MVGCRSRPEERRPRGSARTLRGTGGRLPRHGPAHQASHLGAKTERGHVFSQTENEREGKGETAFSVMRILYDDNGSCGKPTAASPQHLNVNVECARREMQPADGAYDFRNAAVFAQSMVYVSASIHTP